MVIHGDFSWFKNGLTMANNGMIWDYPLLTCYIAIEAMTHRKFVDLPNLKIVIFQFAL